MLAHELKKYYKKILIIDFDILNNSIHTILGVKKYPKKLNNFDNLKIFDLIIKINKKIDLISGINLIFNNKNKINYEKLKSMIEELLEKYDAIIIDTTSECFFEYTKEIINVSNKCVFLTEANLSEISKSKRFLEIYYKNWNIKKEKIKIIFNKCNKNIIKNIILKNIYSEYEILGYLKNNFKYNFLINNNFKYNVLKINNVKNNFWINKDLKKIVNKILKG